MLGGNKNHKAVYVFDWEQCYINAYKTAGFENTIDIVQPEQIFIWEVEKYAP